MIIQQKISSGKAKQSSAKTSRQPADEFYQKMPGRLVPFALLHTSADCTIANLIHAVLVQPDSNFKWINIRDTLPGLNCRIKEGEE